MSPADKPVPRKLRGSLDANPWLNRWLSINRDGTVTVFPGKVEIGQGILTALTQIVAEELDIAIDRIRLAPASTAYSPNEGMTSGSRSIQEGGMALRYAAAEAKVLLLERAAQRLGVSVEQLEVSDGEIRARSGGKTSYWEVAAEELLRREATPDVVAKPPAEHTIVGASIPRRDIPAKVSGVPTYVQDMELPGMLHGRIVRPPSRKAKLKALEDEQEVRALPGVRTLVRDGDFLGVIADREEQAIRAQRRVARSARWEETAALPERTDPRYLLAMSAEDEVISEKSDAAAAARTARRLSAEYSRPLIAHASIGPSCAVAVFENGKYNVWTHSQGIYPLRADLAKVLRVPETDIVVTHAEGAGCYGHNGADDVALDAALLARALPGRPVRVQWMREDEFQWEPYGSGMVIRMGAALDGNGNIVDWTHELWSHGHSTRPGPQDGANLLAAWHLAEPVKMPRPGNPALPAGGSHRNAIPLYEFPNQRVTNHLVREAPLRTSALRSLGAHGNVFAIESFMDELAQAAGADPVEFRLRHLRDPRGRAVIEAVARKAGWRAGERGDGTRGRGIGFARYKNLGCYVAVIVEIEAQNEVRVKRAWAAVDAGEVITPNGLVNQIEGGIVQTVSWTLKEQVNFDRERVTARTWGDYPILTFAETPHIEVEVLNRPGEPVLGAGEGAQGPAAAAIANAVENALGVRLRDMPLTREKLIAALAA